MGEVTPLALGRPEDEARFLTIGNGLDAARLRDEAPQAMMVAGTGTLRSRCSLWWKETATIDGRRAGYIGHFWSAPGAPIQPLLEAAAAELARHGCDVAVGPIDGSTWGRYRFVTERGTEPPFFLEPDNPDAWPTEWKSAGFTPVADYVSSLIPRPATAAPPRPAPPGVRLRPLDPARFQEELRHIYDLSSASFQPNFLFTPISWTRFFTQYLPLQAHLDPHLVLLAEAAGRVIGFSFALSDLLERPGGRTAILKTLAVHPDWAGQGLGNALTESTLDAIWRAGYQRTIGALIHVENRSLRISRHHGDVMRRYQLLGRALRP